MIPYRKALQIQEDCVQDILKKEDHIYLLGLEHPNVITLGKRSDMSDDLLVSKESLELLGFDICHTDRGGHATLHSPGQLVIYPIVKVQKYFKGIREYVEFLEQVVIDCFTQSGVDVFTNKKEPGIYTNRGKIGFIGLRVRQGVSYHGISLNIHNDLSLFENIRSCGVDKEKFDQLSRYSTQSTKNFFELFSARFLDLIR